MFFTSFWLGRDISSNLEGLPNRSDQKPEFVAKQMQQVGVIITKLWYVLDVDYHGVVPFEKAVSFRRKLFGQSCELMVFRRST